MKVSKSLQIAGKNVPKKKCNGLGKTTGVKKKRSQRGMMDDATWCVCVFSVRQYFLHTGKLTWNLLEEEIPVRNHHFQVNNVSFPGV